MLADNRFAPVADKREESRDEADNPGDDNPLISEPVDVSPPSEVADDERPPIPANPASGPRLFSCPITDPL